MRKRNGFQSFAALMRNAPSSCFQPFASQDWQLAAWLAEVQASELEAFSSFVTGVQQDQDAVLADLILPC